MPSLDTLLAFLGISVLITLAGGQPDGHRPEPGPGRRPAAFGLGCAAGCLTHIAWAPSASRRWCAPRRAVPGLKLAGAAWLLRRRKAAPWRRPAAPRPWQRDLARGFVANALNPKVGCSSWPSCPSSPTRPGSLSLQMLVLGLVFIAQTVLIFGSMAWPPAASAPAGPPPASAPGSTACAACCSSGWPWVATATAGPHQPHPTAANNPHATLPSGPPPPASGERHDWQTIKKLLPYLWAYKWRVLFALGCLISPSSPTSPCR
jgi:hypothetical protein